MNTKSFLQWSLVCLIFLFLIGLTGCADMRIFLNTSQGESEIYQCPPINVCIRP
jgi:hypothetical protein